MVSRLSALGVVALTTLATLSAGPAHAVDDAHITGRVSNVAGPLEDADVTAYQLSGGQWLEMGSAETEPDGSYDVDGLPDGTYRVKFEDAFDDYTTQWWDKAATVDTATDIAVAGDVVSGGHDAVLIPVATQLVNLSAPAIRGTAGYGRTLTADPGGWSQLGITFTYDWSVVGRPKLDATGPKFSVDRPTTGDSDLTVELVVTATKAGFGSAQAFAESVQLTDGAAAGSTSGTKLTMTTRPTIAGSAVVGHKLRVRPGSVSPSAVATYQWLRGRSPIPQATGRSYRLRPSDLGVKVSVRVVFARAGYAPLTARSARTAPVTR